MVCVCLGKPQAPRNCSLWNQTAESVEVSCVPGFDGGLPQTFLLMLYSGDDDKPRLLQLPTSLLQLHLLLRLSSLKLLKHQPSCLTR